MSFFDKRQVASWFFLFASIAIALAIQVKTHFDPGMGSIVSTSFMFIAMGLQYLFPEQANRFEQKEVRTDFLYFVLCTVAFGFISSFVVQRVVRWLAPGLLIKSGLMSQGLGILPLPLQVVLFVLTIDLGYYWTHRIAHAWPMLFRFHSIHHAPHRVSVLNGSRAHPIDTLWRRTVPMLLTIQLGFSKDAVSAGVQITIILGIIQHMNVDFRFGILNRVIGTNEIHRWHHSTIPAEAGNYGFLSIWDQVWGTFVMPAGRKRPAAMGLAEAGNRPLHRFFWQMIEPFMPGKHRPTTSPSGSTVEQLIEPGLAD